MTHRLGPFFGLSCTTPPVPSCKRALPMSCATLVAFHDAPCPLFKSIPATAADLAARGHHLWGWAPPSHRLAGCAS